MPDTQTEAPATQSDLRALRRWVLVAGVWAIAATAVGLIALLDTSGDDASERAGNAEASVEQTERELDKRMDELEGQLDDLPQSADVSKLSNRLAQVEEDASAAARDAKSADEAVKDLEERVQTLEDDASSQGTGGQDDASP